MEILATVRNLRQRYASESENNFAWRIFVKILRLQYFRNPKN